MFLSFLHYLTTPPKKEEATRCTERVREASWRVDASRGERFPATAGVDGERGRGASTGARRRASPVAQKGQADAAAVQSGIGEGAQSEGYGILLHGSSCPARRTLQPLSAARQRPGRVSKLQDIKCRRKPLRDRAREGRHHPALRPRVTMTMPVRRDEQRRNTAHGARGVILDVALIHPQADTLQTLISSFRRCPPTKSKPA